MEKLYFDKSIIDGLHPITNARYAGSMGKVYVYKNTSAVKIFKEELTDTQIKFLERNLEKLSSLEVKGVALPTNLIYCEDKFIGYEMPYYNGMPLSILLGKIRLNKISLTKEELSFLYDTLIKKVKELSDNGIELVDVKLDNIIYYNGELCLVDCDFYKFSNKENLFEYNTSLININARDLFFSKIDDEKDKKKSKHKLTSFLFYI